MLPAGLNTTDNNKVEFFARDNKAFAFYHGRVVSFFDLPEFIIQVMRREMKHMPQRCRVLGIDNIADENERLEAYICKEFPLVDNTADFDNGKTNPEIFGSDAIKSFGLTNREVDVLKLTAEGNHIPEIARQLYISPKTAETHSHHIKEKIKAKSFAEMIRFAIRTRLVEV